MYKALRRALQLGLNVIRFKGYLINDWFFQGHSVKVVQSWCLAKDLLIQIGEVGVTVKSGTLDRSSQLVNRTRLNTCNNLN